MFVSVMAFFARVSDPNVGGTYMTLLNTLCNLGGNWPQTLSLWLIDSLTWRDCVGDSHLLLDNSCGDALEKEVSKYISQYFKIILIFVFFFQVCLANEGKCVISLDGFYVETAICTVIGFLWMFWGKSRINKLQSLDEKSWRIVKKKRAR